MDILNSLVVYGVDSKIRLGREHDGGYILADLPNQSYDLYLGCGIDNDVSFDVSLAELYPEMTGYTFDGTIGNCPADMPPQFEFVPKNIDCNQSQKTTDLVSYMGNAQNIFMKMDIEGAEWFWLDSLPDEYLLKIKQLVIEFHYLGDNHFCNNDLKVKVLNRMKEHFYLVHAHGNNYSHFVDRYPYVIECTYVRKNIFETPLEFNKVPLPISIDMPNNKEKSDYELNYWPYVS